MNTRQCSRFFVALTAALLLTPSAKAAVERDIVTLIEANKTACRGLDANQLRGLKLAAKAEQGIVPFMRYVHFNRAHRQWSSDEALALARAAARSPCGVAIGLKPIEKSSVADFIVER